MRGNISRSVENLHLYFRSNATKSIDFRIEQLKKLRAAILNRQPEIERALWRDLHKSAEESYLTEISIVLQEINLHIRKLRRWAKPTKVSTPIHLLPSRCRIEYEPLGVALIIAPWNYPVQLLLAPLVGAISAGCCAMLKPSPAAGETAQIIEEIITETFDSNYINIVQGRRDVNGYLLEMRYDIIFFTGSPELAHVVCQAAAKNLTPTILELGGKSPCIVDKDANIEVAARRIAWGKWINASQTCIAPDYLLVESSIKYKLLRQIAIETTKMYGENIEESPYFPRIISDSAYDRVISLIEDSTIFFGGEHNAEQRYIAPTILDNITPQSAVMQQEIFGPLLPVMTYDDISEAIDYVQDNEKPLALYFFGEKNCKRVISQTSSGGGCINDTLMHITNHKLPFGGVGNSGMGKYHGYDSFLAFSNRRSIVRTPTWIDLPFKYVPYRFFKLLKYIL